MFDKIFGLFLVVLSSMLLGILLRELELSYADRIVKQMRSTIVSMSIFAGIVLFLGIRLALGF